MIAKHLNDADYTLTVSEAPLLDADLTVIDWFLCYFEIRNSAMGYGIVSGIRMNTGSPWLVGPDLVLFAEWIKTADEAAEIPAILIARMEEKGLI